MFCPSKYTSNYFISSLLLVGNRCLLRSDCSTTATNNPVMQTMSSFTPHTFILSLYKLQTLIFDISDFSFGQQDSAVQREGGDVGGDLPRVLL